MSAEKNPTAASEEIQPEPAVEERDALGIEVEDEAKRAHLDFLTAIILILVSIAVIITSIGYWQRQRVTFYESAGFMPVLIAGGLLIMSVRLLREALNQDSVRHFIGRLKVSFGQTVHSNTVHRAIVGLVIFAIYVFALLGRLPFWLASFLSLAAVLVFVRYDGTLKTALKMIFIAALCVAGIVGLFQFAFAVPMP
ncbi:MAG: tripartite tricarboxylate transporter TctB family protein [Clostridiales bacterium]|nr:tripartite tricarboxylate transporter TctB family protein [Clostridiales bacterium]